MQRERRREINDRLPLRGRRSRRPVNAQGGDRQSEKHSCGTGFMQTNVFRQMAEACRSHARWWGDLRLIEAYREIAQSGRAPAYLGYKDLVGHCVLFFNRSMSPNTR